MDNRHETLNPEFEQGLKLLDMFVPDYPGSSGLVLANQEPPGEYERLALLKARKYQVDAIYFRHFDLDRPPHPQVYIYDYTNNKWDEDEVGELHRRLWNSGHVPLFFIFTKTEIKIFNCYKSPNRDPETGRVRSIPMETIQLAAEVEEELEKRKEFSARKFDNGSFWYLSKHKDKFKLGDSSYETLLKHLKAIRKKIINKGILEKSIAQKLLVMAILVKYLEEREDGQGNTVFPQDFFSRFAPGAVKFTDVLKHKGACLKLFDYLSQHFNGEIFQWCDDGERTKLLQTDLKPVAEFLEARIDTGGQGTLWPLYSFNDLPVELISNIYEEFLTEKEGVVYTPPYLVHFLIDEVMPLEEAKTSFKVLDPACGSGIFLVAAYRRIIDWWRIQNHWQVPSLDILKQLLKNNIFGVDIEHEAVRLTIFSLSLVLLDELSPKEIWENLKFENLKNKGNLFEKDFFELVCQQELEESFDLVIGNPPFIEKLNTPCAREIEDKQLEKRTKLPNNNLALLFLEQSMTVCKQAGYLCLIMPSEPFLYNYSSLAFRKYLLQTYHVQQVLDFTFLREILFGSTNAAVAAVFVKKEEPVPGDILHAVFRRTKLAKEKITLELDHYDLHYIEYKNALDNSLEWKTNFLGGGRLHHLLSRLSNLRKFGDYLDEKTKHAGWVMAEGFIIGSKKEINQLEQYSAKEASLTPGEANKLQSLRKKYKKADFLTGQKTLPTDALIEEGIDEKQIYLLEDKYFIRNRGKNKKIYKGPHVLIREKTITNTIPVFYLEYDITFGDTIIGIHAPECSREELIQIETRFKKNKIRTFCASAHSGKHLIKRGTALQKKDIENTPYPKEEEELELGEIETILVDDVLEYMPDLREKGEKSKIFQPADSEGLTLFGETYCMLLNSIYEKFKTHEPIITDNFICFPIYYGEKPQIEALKGDTAKLEDYLERLVYKKMGRHLRMIRIMRIYDNNVIYLVKPKQLKYWLRSTAVRDADETFTDLIKQGY